MEDKIIKLVLWFFTIFFILYVVMVVYGICTGQLTGGSSSDGPQLYIINNQPIWM